jgi:hypothetical protein
MKIKHWQGYGSVIATSVKDNSCDLHVRVVGNHEWGIECRDSYTAFKWLVKRFKRNIGNDDRIIKAMRMEGGYDRNGDELCDYYFDFYKPNDYEYSIINGGR